MNTEEQANRLVHTISNNLEKKWDLEFYDGSLIKQIKVLNVSFHVNTNKVMATLIYYTDDATLPTLVDLFHVKEAI